MKRAGKPIKQFTKEDWKQYKIECNKRWLDKLKADPERFALWQIRVAKATKKYKDSLK